MPLRTSAGAGDDTRPHGGSLSRVRPGEELEQLRSEPEWNSGDNARTLVKYDDLRVVLVALKRYAQLPTHQARGRISIQTVAGHVAVPAEGRNFDLPAGRFLALDQGLPHDVEALKDSAVLLTIAWPHGKGTGKGAGGLRQPMMVTRRRAGRPFALAFRRRQERRARDRAPREVTGSFCQIVCDRFDCEDAPR